MGKPLGERVVERGLISLGELHKGLERQRLYGGRIGYNLVALDLISEFELKDFFQFSPPPPTRVEETKIDIHFISDLLLKHALYLKSFSIYSLAEKTFLERSVVSECFKILRDNRMIEISKGDVTSFSWENYVYRITDTGINRALSLMEENRYIGPVPVALDDYRYATEIQTIKSIEVHSDHIRRAFSDIVLDRGKLNTFGAAVNAGKPIFLYGPPGNGKTTVAQAIGRSLPGEIFVPRSVLVGGQIVVVYDQVNHRAVETDPESSTYDRRWVKIKRPTIISGGELTLSSLDLKYNPDAKYYEAPLQMKANNGLFIVDDFGRQLIDPQTLLNRWIIPLDRRVDFLTLHTGMKFEIPFDQLVIFATNISPQKLADEAFLRRLRYKVKIDAPSIQAYARILKNICESNGLKTVRDVFDHLMAKYSSAGIELSGCHPRDLIDQIIDEAHFADRVPILTKEAIDTAWRNYFVD